MDYEDQTKPCRECKEDFIFTAGEAKFFAEKGFNPPVRCKSCRENRKKVQGEVPVQSQAAPAPQPEVYKMTPRAPVKPHAEDDWDDRRHKKRSHKTRRRYQDENEDFGDY